MPDLVLERVLPSARAEQILTLFSRAGQPEFSAVYDRMYRVRERLGLHSWIGMEGDRAVLHVSLSPEPFSDGTRTIICGLPGDLMADETHRQFWHPVKLVRRMVSDARAQRAADFMLTSYVPAAEGIFRAAGFRHFADVHRHVLPLVWPYLFLRRLLHGERRPALTAMPFDDERISAVLAQLRSSDTFRPVPTRDFYLTRMPRMEYPAGTWLVAGDLRSPDAAVLVSRKSDREVAIADALWRDAAVPLAGMLSSVARWATKQGHRTMTMMTITGSPLSHAAVQAGFFVRPQPHTMMILPLAEAVEIPPPDRWTFTPFVLTSW